MSLLYMPMPSAFNVSRLLMEVTRAEGDPTERSTDDVALKELVREVVDDGGMEASVCGCRLLVKGADPYHLRADRELLRRAIERSFAMPSGTHRTERASILRSTARR